MTDTAIPLSRRIRPYLFLIIAFGVCLRMVYFSEEIGGSHTFRQAMVANQIDSLKSKPYPGPKLGFLERYDQVYDYGVVFYDTPIYQYIAAKVSEFAAAGATHVAVNADERDADLGRFVTLLAREVSPLVRPG